MVGDGDRALGQARSPQPGTASGRRQRPQPLDVGHPRRPSRPLGLQSASTHRPSPRSCCACPFPSSSSRDERLPNGLRLIVSEDHLAPVAAVNVWYDVGSKHEVPGKTGFAHLFEHVMFQGSRARRQGGAHGPRPGRRRDAQRHDLARPDELLRDDAVAPARARDLARGGPDGHAARRAQPGEPRQPARGRQEREALVVRQPAVRLVDREDARPPLPRGAPVPPPDDRLDGGPRRGLDRGRLGVLPPPLRARTTRCCRVVGDVDRATRSARWVEKYFGAIPANPRPARRCRT